MKKINFTEHVLPHIVAVLFFLIVTVFFFKPVFFENKALQQADIQQFQGTAKSIQDFREQTGEEALWAESIFGGMPAYLVSVSWSNGPVTFIKGILSLGLPHPINNIFLCFICYYILMLSFGVRPYLAIAGAIAFGLNTYVIIGLGVGHNARIGAIAFMPLVMAGIHLAFTNRKLLGLGVTTAGLALHLRDNHLQITYYLLLIVAGYGILRLIEAFRNKGLPDFLKTIGILVLAAVLAMGTFFGQFWAITEYTAYSIRGKSDLAGASPRQNTADTQALSKEYAFSYSNGILEPMTLLIPNFYGGGTANSVLEDRKSETFKALQNLANSGDQTTLNQLYPYTSSYWGPQFNTAPYYAGAIIVFVFALGIAFAERKYVLWLVPICALAIVLSWGSSFASFNYFLFDYLPGYNKFRSVTFALIMILFAMPLLGFSGLENLMRRGVDKKGRRKLWIAFASTGGLCLLLILFAGVFSFTKDSESGLPEWFVNALADDRKSLFRLDAFRSFIFITLAFLVIFFEAYRRISAAGFYAFLLLLTTIDLAMVDKRYFGDDHYRRKSDRTHFAMTEADQEILKDKGYYRVYNFEPRSPFATFNEAKTAYHHKSIGGYHGAKLRRYQDYVDSCFYRQVQQFVALASKGNFDFSDLGGFNMLNIKYIYYGPTRENVILNRSANGNGWFVRRVEKVRSAAEELEKTCSLDTKTTAVIDVSAFEVADAFADPAATLALTGHKPNVLTYESNSATGGLAVFSEIYYPKGWTATIDGAETAILRANYILRALQVPAGKHTIEFRFEPKPYRVGNKVTMASSWIVLLVLVGSVVYNLKQSNGAETSPPPLPKTRR
jgi:hypothetical protein